MVNSSKKIVAVVLVIGCVLVFAGLKYYQSSARPVSDSASKLPARAQGNPQANIKIIEFIDFQCPACATGAKMLHEYLEKYPGKIYLELRYFPLKMHAHGVTSARWGECAARQGKFWPFLNQVLDKQKEWAPLVSPIPAFMAFANNSAINIDELNACLADQSVDVVINADLEEGKMRQVSSTPSYFINHELVVGPKSLQSKLDDLLGIKKEESAQGILKYDNIDQKPVVGN